jgi:PST family polysaccharide transporter
MTGAGLVSGVGLLVVLVPWGLPGVGLVAAETLLLGAIYLAALHVVAPGLARTVRDGARAWGRRGKKT